MPTVSAVLVLLAVSTAFAANDRRRPVRLAPDCDVLLTLPKQFRADPASVFLKYDLDGLLLDFRPWSGTDRVLTGHRDGATWIIDFEAGRMIYEFTPNHPGRVGLMAAARTVVRVALSAREGLNEGADGADLRKFAARFTEGGRVRVDLPLDGAGLDFVVGLENRWSVFTPFKPISLRRKWKGEYRWSSMPPEPRPVGLAKRLWSRVRPPAVVATPLPAWTPRDPDAITMQRRFDEGSRNSTAGWSKRQFDGRWRLNPLENEMTFDLPSPGGVTDLVAHGRRVIDVALAIWRGAEPLEKLKVTILPDQAVRVTVPYSAGGLVFIESLEEIAPDPSYLVGPIERDLSAAELAKVRTLLRGLTPGLPLASIKDYFVAPIPRPAPTAAEREAARFATGPALPDAMIGDSETLRKAQLYYGAYSPWTPTEDEWTARAYGVGVSIQRENRRVHVDLGPATPAALERLRWVIRTARGLKKAKGNCDGELNLRLVATDAGAPHLRLEAPLTFVGTAVLAEIRDRATLNQELTADEREYADRWIERHVGPTAELFPLRNAAE